MVKTALYKQIYLNLKERIVTGDLRPNDRVPSEQEIMDEYKVSKITVKNALAALVDEGLVIRIQGKGTFVTPQPFNGDRSRSRSASKKEANNFIGFIVPTMKTRVIQQLVEHLEYFLREAGFHMVLRLTRESSEEESRAICELIESKVRGLVVFPTEDEKYNESLLRLSLDKFPFVFIDRFLRNIETYTITSDNIGGACETVSCLLNKGHRQIALISPENANTTIEDRTAGFERAYIDMGISIDKSLWCHVPLDILRSENALPYLKEFIAAHPQVTAAFALTAEMTNLTYRAMQSVGSSSAGTIELFSFDDPEIPGVPYVKQDEWKLAQTAAQLLIRQMETDYAPQQTVIPVKLVMPAP
ncbi:GntR family transcriptional regulator [Paenibacillus sp. Soil522]|uniref:GntR family transcriptional regulator n=1 Tax=Paenibacillus sp. Soil522 TaxID=1736388 RepID=UPI0006FE6F1C|nr:GntR family transcriptional regulator [Paenibacillus sp. Soil522]KRE28212.1 GntR family transcriptional regulator [Paenibacillus sp. Soil522]